MEEKETQETAQQPELQEEQQQTEPTVEEQLQKALTEIEEWKDKYLRQAAEFDNFRKRVIKEKAELIKTGGEKVITAILPIIDDFERAEDNIGRMNDLEAVKEGVKLIIEKFLQQLGKEGLEQIEAVGQPFNVDYHEAVAMLPATNDEQKGKVVDCIQKGYTLAGKVIRHAKVAVAE